MTPLQSTLAAIIGIITAIPKELRSLFYIMAITGVKKYRGHPRVITGAQLASINAKMYVRKSIKAQSNFLVSIGFDVYYRKLKQ